MDLLERSIVFEYPALLARGDDTLVMVVADGETEQEVYARAWTGAWAQMAQLPRPLPDTVQPGGAPEPGFAKPFVDIRGKSWYQDGRVHWGVTLPSAYTLLSRVNFHRGPDSVYTDIGISCEDARWRVYRVSGRWPEWHIHPIDARSFSREDAKRDGAIVIGDAEHLRCEVLEMGCNLSPHEKEQVREIRAALKR